MNADVGPVVSIDPNSPRAADWLKVFGRTDRIPVTAYLPARLNLPGKPNSEAYMLDLKRITSDERARLVQHIADRFNYTIAVVDGALDDEGMPLLAEDVTGPAIPWRLLV